jgi:competence protein ComEC
MLLVGWGVMIVGMELISFTFLATILLILLALYPALLFSLGFWFSIFGVFYIFLLLTYTKAYPKWIITLLVIPFGIFILMLPVVHTIFGVTTLYQLYSPLFSLLFVPFYPLVIVLHLIGTGDLLDSSLLWLFSLPKEGREHLLSLWMVGGYGVLSLASIWSRKIFFLTFGVALLYAGYLFV